MKSPPKKLLEQFKSLLIKSPIPTIPQLQSTLSMNFQTVFDSLCRWKRSFSITIDTEHMIISKRTYPILSQDNIYPNNGLAIVNKNNQIIVLMDLPDQDFLHIGLYEIRNLVLAAFPTQALENELFNMIKPVVKNPLGQINQEHFIIHRISATEFRILDRNTPIYTVLNTNYITSTGVPLKHGDVIQLPVLVNGKVNSLDIVFLAHLPFHQNILTEYHGIPLYAEECDCLLELEMLCKIPIPCVEFIDQADVAFECKANHVSALKISGKSLQAFPIDLNPLWALEFVDLSFNFLTEFPNSLLDLRQLMVLDLGFNHLQQLPENLGKLTSLQVLDLSNNRINALPSSIQNLTSLACLNLDFLFNISELPDTLLQLRGLRSLHIYYSGAFKSVELLKKMTHLKAFRINGWEGNESEMNEILEQLDNLKKSGCELNKTTHITIKMW